jgi:hypothetical protein
MAEDYRVVGAHEINKWLWSKLKNFEYKPSVKAFKDYKDSGNSAGYNIVPLVPGYQWPQMSDITGNKSPYIVYNYIMSSYASEWWICKEQCAYVIYDFDEERLRAIHAYIIDLMKRMDWTARELNISSDVSDKFDFKYVQLTSASGPDDFAVTTEKTLRGAMVVVSYEYTTDMSTQEGNGMRV